MTGADENDQLGASPAREFVEEGPIVHPRFSERVMAVNADTVRRNGRRFVIAAGLVVLVVASWVAANSPLLDVDRIEVTGVRGARVAEVLEVAGLERGQRMWGLDSTDAEARLESLPWVEAAEVTTDWPAAVRIEVVPARPVAVVRYPSGRFALIDRDGVVVAKSAEKPADVPEVVFDGDPPALGSRVARPEVVAAVDAIPATLGRSVARIDARQGLRLELASGQTVEWCAPSRTSAKVVVTLKLLAALAASGEPWRHLNVCVPSRPATSL